MTAGAGGTPPEPGPGRRDRVVRSGRGSLTDTPPEPLGAYPGGAPEQGFAAAYPEQRGRDGGRPPGPHPMDHPSHPDLPRIAGHPAPMRQAPPPGGPAPTRPGPGHPPPPPPPPRPGVPGPGPATGPAAPTGPVPVPQAHPATTPLPAPAEPVGDGPDGPDTSDEVDQSELEQVGLDQADESVADGWALVRRTQDGDVDAFGTLFDRYHDVVFRFVFYRLGDRGVAEDLTQETFVRAFRRIASVSYQGRDIGAWFVTIARNLVLDHVKSSRYRLEQATPEITDVAPDQHRPGPESEVIAGATHEELLRCVAKLGDDQQECITLRFLQGLSVSETAHIMGRNEGAVKALQHRAVRRLAQLLPEGLR
jgi:RNA polymerase sigma-70 factor, ECF subfamily